jgi:cation:H+ antiporter
VTIINIALLLVGLLALAKGADAFVEGAGGLAARLGIPPLVVGLTIVALGTSAPEAAISITSAAQSAEGMAIAGVFGSNIVNTLVILGITALVVEVPMRHTTMRYEIPFVLIMTIVLLVLCVHDGQLGRIDSMLLLLLFAG